VLPNDSEYVAIYDIRHQSKIQAMIGIGQTFYVSMILALGAYLFSKNTTDLVIDPLENMIERVKHITADPIKATHED